MTEETKTAAPSILTVLVDLSHPNFAGRGLRSRIALAELMSGLARAALTGSDATIVQDAEGKNVGVYMIGPDESGEGREAFKLATEAVLFGATFKQVAEETATFAVPPEASDETTKTET